MQPRLLVPREPAPNLGKLKTRLIAYHECHRSDCYFPEVNHQCGLAMAFLRRAVAQSPRGAKLALVLDIDETSLSNWKEERRDDFGFVAKDWSRWIDGEKAPAIPGTLQLYDLARKDGVAVFFITGRPESLRVVTAANLEAAGYHGWASLVLRGPHPQGQLVERYKSAARAKIVASGYRIILNVGDQMSDLTGSSQAELSVKLPNPFYYIP